MLGRRSPIFRCFWLAALLSLGVAGCADRAWEAALRADDPVAYHRYLRDHPDSPHVAAAQERLDFHKVRRDPSLAAFDAFLDKYPRSQLADALRTQLEPEAFLAARAAGTPEAYAAFLEHYPDGEFVARARGNAAYLEARGFGGRPADLAAFAAAHPESDYANEARRSAESAARLARTRFDRVGLSIRIAPGTPEPDRLRNRFLDRAQAAYRYAGVELLLLPEAPDAARSGRWPAARLEIAHEEGEVGTTLEGGALQRPGHVARTRVTLRPAPDAAPIYERSFDLRIDSVEHVPGTSVLSSSGAPRYWQSFFVPIATAQTRMLVRAETTLAASAVDVDAVDDRSVVLYEDGRAQVVDLADPERPQLLGEYVRPNDLRKWSGVRILGSRVAIFGEEGLELVEFAAGGPQLVLAIGRDQLGTVFAVEPLGDALVIAGARGLLVVDPADGQPRQLLRRVLKGLAVVGTTLVFTDGEGVLVSDLAMLRQKRVYAQLKLGRAFDPGAVRSFDRRAVVIGGGGVVALDLSRPDQPVVTAKVLSEDIGRLDDVTVVGGQVFLLGSRGLLVMEPSNGRVVQAIDVDRKTRLAAMGRHVVAVGQDRLQAVDTTPLALRTLPAARSRGGER